VRTVLLILFVMACSIVEAQEKPLLRPSTDAELWLSAGVEVKPFKKKSGQPYEHKFFKRFRALGELGYRGNENLTSSKLFYTVVGARYRLSKQLRFGLEHRFNVRDRYTTNTHRVDGEVRLSVEKDRISVDYRAIFQHEFVMPIRYRDILRNRVSVEYNIPGWKFDPHLSLETFTAMHYTGHRLIGLRYEAGTTMALNKKKTRTVDLGVRYDREMNLSALKYRWIFVVAYGLEWNR
jgi:hypothetical protein